MDRGAWFSRRFVLTLALGAVAFVAVGVALDVTPLPEGPPLAVLPELLLGMLVVTRLVVIVGHVQNLVLFRRLLTVPAAAEVVLRYDRGTVFTVRRWAYAQPVLLCALAVLLTGRPFFVGGFTGMVLLALVTLIWQRAESRRAGSAPPSKPAAAP